MDKDFHFQWHITNLCNRRCGHCYQSDFSSSFDLDWPGLKAVADNFLAVLKKWNKRAVINLTGGEPFLKKELFKLLEYLNSQKLVKKIGIITNGRCLNDSVISKLKPFKKIKEIKLSLDATSEELNDSIRDKGAFATTLKAIKLLKQHKIREITLMLTLLKKNLPEVSEILNFAFENKISGVIFERFIPWGRGKKIKQEVLSKQEWYNFVYCFLQFLEIPFDKKIFSYKAFWVRFKKGQAHLFGAPCSVGQGAVCIMPNGDVFPCRRFNLKIGNLLKQPLDEIYNGSSVLKDLKKKSNLKGICKSCLIKSCRGCRALAFALTGDYLAEDLQCSYNENSAQLHKITSF